MDGLENPIEGLDLHGHPATRLLPGCPLRPVDWRWERAGELLEPGVRRRRWDDAWVARARRFRAALARPVGMPVDTRVTRADPAVHEAYLLWRGLPRRRWELEAGSWPARPTGRSPDASASSPTTSWLTSGCFSTSGTARVHRLDHLQRDRTEALPGVRPRRPGDGLPLLHRYHPAGIRRDQGDPDHAEHCHRARHVRGLSLPAELAGDLHPDDCSAGLADRHVRDLPAARLLHQHLVALRPGARHRPRRGRRHCRRRGGGTSH